MTDTDTKEMKVHEKQAVATPAEQTRPGLVFTPVVDIYESEMALTLLADLPGVTADRLSIDLRDNVLTLVGDVSTPDMSGEDVLFEEYETGQYYRRFTLSEVIDQSAIDAELNDGVLRLTLPKVEKATPRKITVRAA
jgi:HSP20 family molecular chaperone IbpA